MINLVVWILERGREVYESWARICDRSHVRNLPRQASSVRRCWCVSCNLKMYTLKRRGASMLHFLGQETSVVAIRNSRELYCFSLLTSSAQRPDTTTDWAQLTYDQLINNIYQCLAPSKYSICSHAWSYSKFSISVYCNLPY